MEESFWRNFLGEIFWEDFFGGKIFIWEDFLGGFLWEDILGGILCEINKELMLMIRFWGNFVSMEGGKEEEEF